MKSRITHYIIAFFAIVAILSSCISSEEINYLQTIPKDYSMVKFEEYKLAIRDLVNCQISTSDEEIAKLFADVVTENTGDTGNGIGLLIYEDGTVILPFFGAVEIVGLTIQEAENKIQKFIQESILDAEVKLVLMSKSFYIYSNERQGQYLVYKENMTIYQALAISGQTTEKMDLSKVQIVRKGDDGQDIIKVFDLRSRDVIQSEFYYIKPNDVIYFATNKNAFFNVTSVSSFIQMVVTPLTFLFFVATYKF